MHKPALKQAEYIMFPRPCALAEVGWFPKDSRDWNDFMRRLAKHLPRLDQPRIQHRLIRNPQRKNSTKPLTEPETRVRYFSGELPVKVAGEELRDVGLGRGSLGG